MCSIMGYTSRDISLSKLQKAFAATKNRGPDDSRALELPSGTLLFHRLAIMGPEPAGMRPFAAPDGSAVVCNGELYGFRKLKKEMAGKGYRFAQRVGLRTAAAAVAGAWSEDVRGAGRGVRADLV